MLEQYMSVAEAARVLHLSEIMVRRLCREGRIVAYKKNPDMIKSPFLVSAQSVWDLIERRKQQQQEKAKRSTR